MKHFSQASDCNDYFLVYLELPLGGFSLSKHWAVSQKNGTSLRMLTNPTCRSFREENTEINISLLIFNVNYIEIVSQ